MSSLFTELTLSVVSMSSQFKAVKCQQNLWLVSSGEMAIKGLDKFGIANQLQSLDSNGCLMPPRKPEISSLNTALIKGLDNLQLVYPRMDDCRLNHL